MIDYRKSRKPDLKYLVDIDKLANKENLDWKPLSLSQFLKIHTKYSIYLAIDKKRIVGYLSTEVKKQNKENVLFLDNLFVLKEYRKEGVSKNLVNIFLEENKSKFSIIKLHSPKSLENFYKKFNFKTNYLTMVLKD
jgi:predicted acetyltransferase